MCELTTDSPTGHPQIRYNPHMKHIQNLIIDMDGVLWHGNTPLPGLVEFFETLRRLHINFMLATNNASKTPAAYKKKLADFGVEIDSYHILNSAEATAQYVRGRHEAGTAVYIVGDVGLHEAMKAQGFRILTADEVFAGETAVVVTVGFSQTVTYKELAAGAICVRKGAEFIGCNPDPSFPSEYGPLPGAGALIAVIETATSIKPTIIGKPGPAIFNEAMARLQAKPEHTAMIGDRLATDIAGGKAAGIQTILVLSGITQKEDLNGSDLQPDYIMADIIEVAAQLEAAQQHAVQS